MSVELQSSQSDANNQSTDEANPPVDIAIPVELEPVVSIDINQSVDQSINQSANFHGPDVKVVDALTPQCCCVHCPLHTKSINPLPVLHEKTLERDLIHAHDSTKSADITNQSTIQAVDTTINQSIDENKKDINPFIQYLSKFQGQRLELHQRMSWSDMFWAFIGSFLGIAFPALLSINLIAEHDERYSMLIASFGATAVLLYSASLSDLAQPRALIGGHMISAFVGVCFRKMFPVDHNTQWLVASLAVSFAILAMNLTRTLHAPGGATAVIAVLPSVNNQIQDLGFLYIVLPVAAGAICMLIVATIVNNIPRARRWPKWWLGQYYP